jgi:YebC/PmpR family DNA-binding regulatory protein
MGRIFETRKATMFARYDRMAKAFSRVGREITIAVKAGGPDPDGNPTLRRAVQNGRAVNMPKDKIEAAIKRAMGPDTANYEEVIYEGYAPHGIALLVVTTTDNPTRTIANVRVCFNKCNGSIGTSGSVNYLFSRMCMFRLDAGGHDLEELELDLIDHGLEELGESEGESGDAQILIRGGFTDFGNLQSAIEERGLKIIESDVEYIPSTTTELGQEHADDVMKLIARLEGDDDVQKVFHNLA